MKILILGGDGMLGHQLLRHFSANHEAMVTLRQDENNYEKFKLFTEQNSYFGIDVLNFERIIEVISDFKPDVVINAVGIVKQRSASKESIPSIEINSLLPHKLAILCRAAGARLVHMSTDCVFSGKKGNYTEDDISDAEDLYGKSKFMGEVHDSSCITLRTSMIGRELSRHKSLLDWFLSQKGTVNGYTNAIYTGFTTHEIARIIEMILTQYPNASGVYHVSSDPINKYDLLMLVKEKFRLGTEIIPYEGFNCDRSLKSDRFRKEFNYPPPSWEDMIEEIAKDSQYVKEGN